MTRFNLIITACAAVALGAAAAAHAQNASPPNCGIETYSVDKQAYVTVPCVGGADQQAGSQTAKAPGSPNCGIESYSVDKQAYVGTPCPAGTTYENPSGKKDENFNSK